MAETGRVDGAQLYFSGSCLNSPPIPLLYLRGFEDIDGKPVRTILRVSATQVSWLTRPTGSIRVDFYGSALSEAAGRLRAPVHENQTVEDTPTLAGKPVLGSLLVERAGTALMVWLGCALNPADFTSSKPSIPGPLWWSPVLCTFL